MASAKSIHLVKVVCYFPLRGNPSLLEINIFPLDLLCQRSASAAQSARRSAPCALQASAGGLARGRTGAGRPLSARSFLVFLSFLSFLIFFLGGGLVFFFWREAFLVSFFSWREALSCFFFGRGRVFSCCFLEGEVFFLFQLFWRGRGVGAVQCSIKYTIITYNMRACICMLSASTLNIVHYATL